MHTVFRWGNLREGDHLEDSLVDWRIILKVMFEKWVGGMDWIDLAQDMVRRRVVNEVINVGVP